MGKMQDVPRSEQLPSARVEADLRRRLDAGEWATGEALPPVAQLAGEYEVARGTVARVLAKLAGEGLVRIVPRWGTFRARYSAPPGQLAQDGVGEAGTGRADASATLMPWLWSGLARGAARAGAGGACAPSSPRPVRRWWPRRRG